MIKMTIKNMLLLMGTALLIILILAAVGINVSAPVPFGGVIIGFVVLLSTLMKYVFSKKLNRNEN